VVIAKKNKRAPKFDSFYRPDKKFWIQEEWKF